MRVTPQPGPSELSFAQQRSMHAATDSATDRITLALRIGALCAVLLTIGSLAAPLWRAGFPAGHDTGAHLTYAHLFDRALRDGQFPVRWVELPRTGHSQPLFNFYQPGFYYLVCLTHLFVPSLALSLKLTIAWLWWLGSGFTFLWSRRYGIMPAALAALLFACAPYLILDVLVRAAFPEMAAIAFAPAVLFALDRFLRTDARIYALALAVFVGAMLVCHLPSFLICAPAFVAYACCVPPRAGAQPRSARLRALLVVAAAVLLGCGLAAFYVMPALMELDLIAMSRLTMGYFDYHQHFVYPVQWVRYGWGYGGSVAGPDDQMSFQIGVAQWVMLAGALGVATGSLVRGRKDEAMRVMWCWLGVAAFAMFFMTDASVRVWDAVAPLAFIQFPWRFLMLVSLSAAALSALLLSTLRRRPALQALVVLAAAGAMWPLTQAQLKPERYIPAADYAIDDASWARSDRAAANAFIETGYTPALVTRFPTAAVGRWTVSRGEGSVRERAVADDRLDLVVKSPEGIRLTINSHAFPGWKAWVDRQEAPVSVEPGFGFLQLEIPPGSHRVEARFTNTPVRTAANAVSAASLVFAAGAALRLLRGRWLR
jgi:hypothetical protein